MKNSIGRLIGLSHRLGQDMSYWILLVSGILISCTTLQRLMHSEKSRGKWKARMSDYDTKISERLDVKNSDLTMQAQGIDQWNKLSIADEDTEPLKELNSVISDFSIPDGPYDNAINDNVEPIPVPGNHDQETVTSDAYVDMKLGLTRGGDDSLMHAIVKQRKLDDDVNPIRNESTNPLVDTRAYEI